MIDVCFIVVIILKLIAITLFFMFLQLFNYLAITINIIKNSPPDAQLSLVSACPAAEVLALLLVIVAQVL